MFTSCGDKNPLPSEQKSNVYVVGTEDINGENFITLWKNGKAERFSIGTNAFVISSAVLSGSDDVYATGIELINSVWAATIWKNGVAKRLGETDSQITSVFLSGNDVFAVAAGKLWKNNVAQSLNLTNYDELFDVYTTGNNVYAVGDIYENEKRYPLDNVEITISYYPTVWTNGVMQYLTDGIDDIIDGVINQSIDRWKESGNYIKVTCAPTPYCIYVSENKEYVAVTVFFGTSENYALLWENGKMQYHLEGGGIPKSIYTTGGNVYVAGYKIDGLNGGNSAILWVNGNATILSNNTSNAQSIVVSDNKVYIAGSESVNGKMVSTLWVNGNVQHLTENEGTAYYVCVK